MSALTDPVADYLTRIRNAQKARHPLRATFPRRSSSAPSRRSCSTRATSSDYVNVEDDKQGLIRVYLKYLRGGKPVIQRIDRVSTPGLRRFVGADNLPRVMNGLGIAIISTSRGVMTDKEARRADIGGEVLAVVN